MGSWRNFRLSIYSCVKEIDQFQNEHPLCVSHIQMLEIKQGIGQIPLLSSG